MTLLQSFKDHMASHKQTEEFDKMLSQKHPIIFGEGGCSNSVQVFFKEISWELLLAHDKIASLESKINAITDEMNKPAEPPQAVVPVAKKRKPKDAKP